MLRKLWGFLAIRLVTVWTLIAVLALMIWLSGLPVLVRIALLAVLIVFQWTVIDRVAGLRGRPPATGSADER